MAFGVRKLSHVAQKLFQYLLVPLEHHAITCKQGGEVEVCHNSERCLTCLTAGAELFY